MENREKQLQELKKEYQDIHMSEEQLLQMKLKISQAKQENSRQGSNAAHSSVSHRRSIARRCGIAAAAAAAALVMIVLAFLIWFCTLTLHISAVLLNILSVLLVLVSVFSFIDHNVKNGVIKLVAAFLLSPYGLPMLGAWLVAQLHLLRDWMKEKVY